MEEILDNFLVSMGLGSPLARYFAGFGVVNTVLLAWKPSFLFTEEGRARPSRLLTGKKTDETVIVPWWGYGVLGGALFAIY